MSVMKNKLQKALFDLLESMTEASDNLQELKSELDKLKSEMGELKTLALQNTMSSLPDWIPTKKAMEILCIKNPQTLRTWAAQGLVTQQRGADRRNYYLTREVMTLPNRLIGDLLTM